MLNRNKIILTWHKIKEGLFSSSKKEDSLKLYKDFIYKNLKGLKKQETSKTRSDIELIMKHRTFLYPYDENLYKIYLNNIFAITLGMIDSRIKNYDDKITVCIKENRPTKFLLDKNEEMLNYRKNIIKDIEYFISDDEKEIIKLLKTIHSSITREDLFEYMRTNKNEFNVAGELLNAYIYGYNRPLLNDYEELFLFYKETISEFSKIKAKNNCRIQKVKSINKKK